LTSVGATPAHRLIKGSGAADRCRKGSCLHRHGQRGQKMRKAKEDEKRKGNEGLAGERRTRRLICNSKEKGVSQLQQRSRELPQAWPQFLPALLATADNPPIPSQGSNNRQTTRKQRTQGFTGPLRKPSKGRALSRDALRLKEPRLQLGLSSRLAFERTNKHGRPR
jgi:hypothetical protein